MLLAKKHMKRCLRTGVVAQKVQVPGSQAFMTLVPGGLTPLCWPLTVLHASGTQIHITCRQNTNTHNIFKNFKNAQQFQL